MGTGEKTDALEVFHPDRLAGRILGMGDILTLAERAQETFDATQAAKMEENASLRRSLRFFLAFTLPSPVCATIRLRTHEPRMPARKKRHPKRTSIATAIAIASGPPGP